MSVSIEWKKELLTNSYELFNDSKPIGEVKNKPVSRTALAAYSGQKYLFETKGIFRQKTRVIDMQDREEIGIIRYNTWQYHAGIYILGEQFRWEFKTKEHKEWGIYEALGKEIMFFDSIKGGIITINNDVEKMLLLSGLFIINKY